MCFQDSPEVQGVHMRSRSRSRTRPVKEKGNKTPEKSAKRWGWTLETSTDKSSNIETETSISSSSDDTKNSENSPDAGKSSEELIEVEPSPKRSRRSVEQVESPKMATTTKTTRSTESRPKVDIWENSIGTLFKQIGNNLFTFDTSQGKWILLDQAAQQLVAQLGEQPYANMPQVRCRTANSWTNLTVNDMQQVLTTAARSSPIQRERDGPSKAKMTQVNNAIRELQFNSVPGPSGAVSGRTLPLLPELPWPRDAPVGKQVVFPLSLYAHVTPALIERIKKNGFTDFHQLLVDSRINRQAATHGWLCVQQVDGTYAEVSQPTHLKEISHWGQWQKAYCTFMAIYVNEFPHRAQELLTYMYEIQCFASTYQWHAVASYDYMLRHAMSMDPMRSWAEMDEHLFKFELVPFVMNRNNRFSRNGKKKPSNVCRLFNKGQCKFGKKCKYEHKCDQCGKMGHNSPNCWESKKENPVLKNNNGSATPQPVQASD